ncbi:MAG TPA: PTS sugar transporter subunit IIA [Candidatus Binatia bacterium]|nr:PTS sugar transporter subunit IIA [Candidatus Binatia bacterium]
MNVTLREAARLLDVSEKTLYRWIQKGVLPAYRIHDEYRFNRVELEEWAVTHRRPLRPPPAAAGASPQTPPPNLGEAIVRGGVYYRVGGRTRDQVFESLVTLPGIPRHVNSALLLEMLRTREGLASTAVGGGFAVPHPRNPLVLGVEEPTVLLCFLEHPVDFGALDGVRVHTLFLLLSPTVEAHLQTLARIAFVLRDAPFRRLLEKRATREALLGRLAELRPASERSRPVPRGPRKGAA